MFNLKLKLPARTKKYKKDKVLPNPNVYWAAIFYSGLALALIVIIYGVVLFFKINGEDAAPSLDEKATLEKVSAGRVNKVLGIFEEREKKTNSIVNSPAQLVDPSL